MRTVGPHSGSRHRLLSRGALLVILVATLGTGACSSDGGARDAATSRTSASPDGTATTDVPSSDVLPRSTADGRASDPPCMLGAASTSCHGWTNTIVSARTVPFVQSMTCTYNVPDRPTQVPSAAGTRQDPEVLYLYCQIVGGVDAAEFGQLAPQIAFGANFDSCGRPRPTARFQWYMQAMYWWRSPDGTGQCVGGAIYRVDVGVEITSTIAWDDTDGWWVLSITDGTNTSTQTVKAPQAPSGENATLSWSDFSSIVPGGSFEMWNGTEPGDYPADDWNMMTTFVQLPGTPISPAQLQMVPVGRNTNPTTVTCTPQSSCTWSPPPS